MAGQYPESRPLIRTLDFGLLQTLPGSRHVERGWPERARAVSCGVIPPMAATDVLSTVRSSLETIADSLDEVSFVIPGPRRDEGETARTAVIETIRKYLLHRLREPDAPVVAALVGLSGVGKSTILNSLAQDTVSAPGVVRPTTTSGVLWAHRDHAARYWTEFVGRVRDQIGPTTDIVIGDDALTRHLTFIDTPPLELIPEGTATTASETLVFADLCVFVTSAGRYADAAPFDFLGAARARGIPILFVLNRLPDDAQSRRQLLVDFAHKLVAAGLMPDPDPEFIFGVDEAASLRWHGGLAPEAVGSLRKELSEVSDPEFRIVMIDGAAEATVRAIADRAESLAAMLRAESAERTQLAARAHEIYDEATLRLSNDLDAGRFAELAGREVWAQASLDLAGLITRATGVAAEETANDWLVHPGGRGLVDPGHEGLRRHGPEAAQVTRVELDEWMRGLDDVVSPVRLRLLGKRKKRRLVRDLWRAVLDPGSDPRRWRRDRGATVARARELLVDAMARALAADTNRFSRRLGSEIAPGLSDRVLAAATYLRDMPSDHELDGPGEEATNGN